LVIFDQVFKNNIYLLITDISVSNYCLGSCYFYCYKICI